MTIDRVRHPTEWVSIAHGWVARDERGTPTDSGTRIAI